MLPKKRVRVNSGGVVTRDKKDGGGFVRGMGYILCKLSKKMGMGTIIVFLKDIMKKELVEKARKVLQRGEREIEGYKIYTSKIDLDVKLESYYEKLLWNDTRRAIITSLGGMAVDIITTDTERGNHTVINWLSKTKYTGDILNFFQMILGDDIVRYRINKARLERGVTVEESNIVES